MIMLEVKIILGLVAKFFLLTGKERIVVFRFVIIPLPKFQNKCCSELWLTIFKDLYSFYLKCCQTWALLKSSNCKLTEHRTWKKSTGLPL